MTETLPAAEQTEDPVTRPVVPRRTVRVVIDAGDDPNLNRRLAALEAASRIVIRPNPVRSTTDLVWDVLAAAGKNSAAVHSPRLSVADACKAVAAWLSAARVTDVIVERAHRLLPGEGLDLAKLADRIDADLWLIWSLPADPTRTCNSIESLGRSRRNGGRLPLSGPHRSVRVIGISIFHDLLPLPAPAGHQPLHPDEHADIDADWPALPSADFPLFLATCCRSLAGDTSTSAGTSTASATPSNAPGPTPTSRGRTPCGARPPPTSHSARAWTSSQTGRCTGSIPPTTLSRRVTRKMRTTGPSSATYSAGRTRPC